MVMSGGARACQTCGGDPRHLCASCQEKLDRGYAMVSRPRRMPARYKREPLGELEREMLARALVLPWVPEACPKCNCEVLRSRGLEVSCPLCGWCQMVR